MRKKKFSMILKILSSKTQFFAICQNWIDHHLDKSTVSEIFPKQMTTGHHEIFGISSGIFIKQKGPIVGWGY